MMDKGPTERDRHYAASGFAIGCAAALRQLNTHGGHMALRELPQRARDGIAQAYSQMVADDKRPELDGAIHAMRVCGLQDSDAYRAAERASNVLEGVPEPVAALPREHVPYHARRGARHARQESRKALGPWTLQELLATRPPSTVVVMNAADTVGDTMKALHRHGILSAPVVDQAGDRYVGFVSVANIVAAFLRGINPAILRSLPSQLNTGELRDAGTELLETFTSAVVPALPDGKLVYKAHTQARLEDVIRDGFLGEFEGGAVSHRIAIFDLEGGRDEASMRICSILSQSDVVRWMAKRAHPGGDLELLASLSVAELGLTDRAVHTVDALTPALTAFSMMHDKGVSSLAVVAPPRYSKAEGVLMGNVSQSDLRGLTDFGLLAKPVAEYLAIRHGHDYWNAGRTAFDESVLPRIFGGVRLSVDAEGGGPGEEGLKAGDQAFIYAICCRPETKLSAVINAFVTHRVHHVFVISSSEMPLSCITPTDVLKLLCGGEDSD